MTKIISIDGSDCTGKSTLAGNLMARLTAEGKKVKVLHFPRYDTEIGKLILRHLKGEFRIDVAAFQYLYIADQMDYTRNGLFIEDMANYDYIIFDRYKDSSLVYFMANKPRNYCTIDSPVFYADDFEDVMFRGKEFTQAQNYICDPDYRILLHIDENILEERLNQKDKDVHEANFEFMKTVNQLYSKVGSNFNHISRTMTMDVSGRTEEEMLNHVYDFIEKEEE